MIQQDKNLNHLNSFGVHCTAKFFSEVTSEQQLISLMKHPNWNNNQHLWLGDGSNILFKNDFNGWVFKISIPGIELIADLSDADSVVVQAGAGLCWDHLVQYCVQAGYGGIENLSGIPGTVGAAPVQNIGAYGVELADCLLSCRVLDCHSGTIKTLSAAECDFAYRSSLFKNDCAGRWCILAITLRLQRQAQLNLAYQGVSEMLHSMKATPTVASVRQAIIKLRQAKLPDPQIVNNAGSFFKNPVVSQAQQLTLLNQWPEMPYFALPNDQYKLSAAWFIEQCGWKGKTQGSAGVYHNHALVLVNHGQATGAQIWSLAQSIQQHVQQRFSIELQPEPRIIE